MACLTVLVGAFAGGGFFAYGRFMRSGAIAVREVSVFGSTHVGSELADYLRLGKSTPLSAVDAALIEARLAKHPWVKRAVLEKHYPHKLVVRIEERRPALLHLADKLYLVDTDGAWIKTVAAGDGYDLPVATNVAVTPVTVATERLRALAGFVGYWDAATSPVRVGEVRFVSADEVAVYTLAGGTLLRLPLSAARWPVARERLVRVLEQAKKMNLELRSIDLLYPDRAVAVRKT
jgi:cell division protein FtsQ